MFHISRSNFRLVVPGAVYRSAQPTIDQLRRWIDRHDIRTVVNLRGYHGGETRTQEIEFLAEQDIKYIEIHLQANKQMTRAAFRELVHAIDRAEPPLLVHCHRGVDRAGTAATLAAMAFGGMSYERAKWHAYVAPGPWKRVEKGDYAHVSDILTQYERYCRTHGLDTAGWEQFRQWALNW